MRAESPRYYRLIRGQNHAVDTSGGYDRVLPWLKGGVGERRLPAGVRVNEFNLRIGARYREHHRNVRRRSRVVDCRVESLRGSLRRIR